MRVQELWLRVWGQRIMGVGFRVLCVWLRVEGSGSRGSGGVFRVRARSGRATCDHTRAR